MANEASPPPSRRNSRPPTPLLRQPLSLSSSSRPPTPSSNYGLSTSGGGGAEGAGAGAGEDAKDQLTNTPIDKLLPQFAELGKGFHDLEENLKGLSELCQNIDHFNQSFSAFLYGIKCNAYATQFSDQPTDLAFRVVSARQSQAAQADLARPLNANNLNLHTNNPNPTQEPSSFNTAGNLGATSGSRGMRSKTPGFETTWVSDQHWDDEDDGTERTIVMPEGRSAPGTVRGRGRGSGRGGAAGGKAKLGKKVLLTFACDVIDTLPIKYREEQPHRPEMELILTELRQNPAGLHIPQITKAHPRIPSHRVNAALTTLVQAKHCLRENRNGLLYRLDPLRHPPAV